MSTVEIGEFKGNPTISLKKNADDKYPFSFGIEKAKLIIEHIEEIKQFVEDKKKGT